MEAVIEVVVTGTGNPAEDCLPLATATGTAELW